MITVFGEILWDIFKDEKTIGGAPFNFAAHAAKLGADVNFISAVGCDELGKEAISLCQKYSIPTNNIAHLPYPTGKAVVTLQNGTPSYDLVENSAYDFIPVPEYCAQCTLTQPPCAAKNVFYFGTLAQRNIVSRESLFKLLNDFKSSNYPEASEVFFDINIRQNYYSEEIIEASLRETTILKISREEIGVLGISGNPEEICRQIFEKYSNINLIIVTLDSDGAFAIERCGEPVYSSKPNCTVVSTVGAGDSFSAAFLVSRINGQSIKDSLESATKLASYVCSNTGAIPG